MNSINTILLLLLCVGVCISLHIIKMKRLKIFKDQRKFDKFEKKCSKCILFQGIINKDDQKDFNLFLLTKERIREVNIR